MTLDSNTIRELSFGKSAFGYNVDEVHTFLNEVADKIESLEKELADTQPKLVALAEKVAEYRGYEDSLKTTLSEAQKIAATTITNANRQAEETLEEANRQAEETVSKANAEAEATVSTAKAEADNLTNNAREIAQSQTKDLEAAIEGKKAELAAAEQQVADFKAEMLALYKEQIALFAKMPDVKEAPAEEAPAADEPEEIFSSSDAEAAQEMMPGIKFDSIEE